MNMSEANKQEQEYLKLKEQNERHKQRCKKNYYKNHEENLKKRAEWRQNEDYKLMMKNYRESEAGKKSARITRMKQYGIISDDYEALYEKWKNTTHCEECGVELIEGNNGKNKKILDHDHKTGLFRNVICHRCNTIRGMQDNGVIRQTNEQYNENRVMARKIKKFRLKWDLKKGFASFH
jgi:hypothetical protein